MYKKFAFTLAEVLITLGIIGVVAAMTLPTLIQNYRKHIVETRLAKFYSTINQAIKLAEVEYGDKKVWSNVGHGYVTDENDEPTNESIPLAWVNKYLKPYLNGAEVSVTTNGNAFIKFSDGSAAVFSNQGIQFWPESKDFVDLTTAAELKKVQGYKTFAFLLVPYDCSENYKYHCDKGVEPYAYSLANDDEESIRNHAIMGCNTNPSHSAAFCTKLIQMNGWKIPKDYPHKF